MAGWHKSNVILVLSAILLASGAEETIENAEGTTAERILECDDIANEVPHNCSNSCSTPTCQNPYPSAVCLDPMECHKGCVCKPGLVRESESGPCIPLQQCPKNCTQAHETFKTCGSACAPSCQDRREDTFCIQVCLPGCYCEVPYIRDSVSGRCVTVDQCS